MIRIRGMRKTYPGQDAPAVVDLTLGGETGQFLTLLGPSGCGKSTTLRCIAGLETPDSGEIWIGDQLAYSSAEGKNLAPSRRRLGMVAQSYAIWPHMTVAQNVEYPLKRAKVGRAQRRLQVMKALEQVGLAEFADRPAPRLSGGQQQRVALARALVSQPEVLILDEPLSNLDAKLRRELGTYLRDLQRSVGVGVVYVTHDQDEAMAMSDVVVLMNKGRIYEQGAPEEIYTSPRTAFGAQFVGEVNFIKARAVRSNGASTVADTVLGLTGFIDPHAAERRDDGSASAPVQLMVRPENVTMSPAGDPAPAGANHGAGTVHGFEFRGMYWEVAVLLSDGTLMTARTQGSRWWEVGTAVEVSFSPFDCRRVGGEPASEAEGVEVPAQSSASIDLRARQVPARTPA